MTGDSLFYFGPGSVFSHWYICEFEIGKQKFCCVEQYLMYQKAILFHDAEIAGKIMNSSSPVRHRYLGKQVSGFNKKLWHEHCRQYAFEGNFAKFSQNPLLNAAILESS